MLANAMSQRAARVLVLRPLKYRLSNAVSMGGRRRNGGASVSGADGVFAAYGTLSSSFALRRRARMLANAMSQGAAWVLVLRPLNYRLSNAVSMGGRRRNGGASVSGADRTHEASETLSSSFALRRRARMLSNAVSQRAARVLVLRPLNYRLSDAVSMGGRRRNGGASVSGADGMHEASETLSSSFVLRRRARMLANAMSQRAARMLVLRPLNYRVSNAVSMGGRRRNGGASVSGADRTHEASETLSSSFALWHHARTLANAVSRGAARVLVLRPLNYHLSDAVSAHVAPRNGVTSVSAAGWVRTAYAT
jgi:hypothetical protein